MSNAQNDAIWEQRYESYLEQGLSEEMANIMANLDSFGPAPVKQVKKQRGIHASNLHS